MTYNMLIVGVGGQGIILVSDILSRAALKQGMDVKKSETHGMAQRGGSVVTHVRMGDEEIQSPLVPKGKADLILAFEPLEALRYLEYVKKDTKLIVNKNPVKIPGYPKIEEILEELEKRGAVVVDAQKPAIEAGHPLTQNIVLLGVASKYLPLKKEVLKGTIKTSVKRALEENLRAFELGSNLS